MVPQDIVPKGPLYDFLVGPDLLEMLAPEAESSTINGAHQPVNAQLWVPQDVIEEGPVYDFLLGPDQLEMLAPEAENSLKLSLLRNKKAVHLYRQKKKQYVKNLTDRVAMLEKLNSKLKQEIKTLKEIYQKTPGC
uniref:BZIP domain-containing protein n=1 Tax=Gouania willdenowi TaxID=441366 RepID=A0A8C5GT61_GOUWI